MGNSGASQLDAGEVIRSKLRRKTIAGRYHRLPVTVSDHYHITREVIGSGMSGSVLLARHKKTGRGVAAKVLSKRKNFMTLIEPRVWEDFTAEMEIALRVDSPYVVKVLDVYETQTELHLLMSLLRGGSLVDVLRSQKRCPERDVQRWARQLCLALNYLHGINLVHRDLKPGNVMFEGPDVGEGHVQLIDFGLSKFMEPGERCQRACGTYCYKAPEVLNKDYSSQCDMWSLGVLIFRCILGHLPFEGERKQVEANIREGKSVIKNKKGWKELSPEARDFMEKLIVMDPDQRLTAEGALEHPWLSQAEDNKSWPPKDCAIAHQISSYTQSSHFKRACLLVMVWSTSNEHGGSVKETFEAMDVSNNGQIDLEEFVAALMELSNLSKDECVKMFRIMDTDGAGSLEFSELAAAMVSSDLVGNRHVLHSCFSMLDVNKSGCIELEDFQEVFGEHFAGVSTEDILFQADRDGDGVVTFHEFLQHMCGDLFEQFADETFVGDPPETKCCLPFQRTGKVLSKLEAENRGPLSQSKLLLDTS